MIIDQPRQIAETPAAHSRELEVAISVRDVGKMYRIYDRPQDRLKQMLWRGRRRYGREFWALRDVSFEVHKGETVGIIGRNGSGKSTLLQIIAGTLAPTRGDVYVAGRVAALLELGSGFDPEFTGRENVFLNGAILGLSREEMEQRFDEIAAFADIGEFIEQPVKMYSSGMFVRLAFAVQACADPDILIVDEALAVGDIFFRQKCYRRLESLREKGTAIMLVSHSMMEIEQFCRRAVLLHHGDPVFLGSASEAVKRYMLIEQQDRAVTSTARQDPAPPLQITPVAQIAQDIWPALEAFLDIRGVSQVSNGWARCTGVALCDSQGRPCRAFRQGERASFFYEFELLHDIEVPTCGTVLYNDKGTYVHGKTTLEYGAHVPMYVPRGSRLRFRHDIALEIAMGEYTFELGLSMIGYDDYVHCSAYSYTEVEKMLLRLCHLPNAGHLAVMGPPDSAPIQLLHHGVANLPGDCRLLALIPESQNGAGREAR